MIDHFSLLVSDYSKSLEFYLRALAPLGTKLVKELTREEIPDLPWEEGRGEASSRSPFPSSFPPPSLCRPSPATETHTTVGRGCGGGCLARRPT